MRYKIFSGTEIFPYAQETGKIGVPRLSTIDVTFELVGQMHELKIDDFDNGRPASFYCLPLPENESPFDSYLVRESDVDEG